MAAPEEDSKPSASFPFNRCKTMFLRDSKNSLTSQLRDSLRDYTASSPILRMRRSMAMDPHRYLFTGESLETEAEEEEVVGGYGNIMETCSEQGDVATKFDRTVLIDEMESGGDGDADGDISDHTDTTGSSISSISDSSSKSSSDCSMSSSNSILKVNDGGADRMSEGVQRLYSLIENCIKMSGESKPNKEILTFVLNTVLTDNHYSNLNMMKPLRNDAMTSLTKFIKSIYVGRHVDVELEAFFDKLAGLFRFEDGCSSVEDPGLYNSFANIWKYDREEALYYDDDYYRSRFLQSHYSHTQESDEWNQSLLKIYLERLFFMNMKRSKYYMIRSNRNSSASYTFEDANDLSSEEYEDLDQINRRHLNQFIPPRKSEITINFSSDINVRTFHSEDPPVVFY